MQDTGTIGRGLPRARFTASRLRDELLAIGVPEEEAELVDARVGTDGHTYISMPNLTIASADRVLAALYARNARTPLDSTSMVR